MRSKCIGRCYQYASQYGYYTHYQEPDFGYLQLGVRFYDPNTGRFTQLDPIRDGINWYAYAGGNPASFVDPFGLFPCPDGGFSWLDGLQLSLDAAGLIPGYGEVADFANSLISLGRGDYVGAGLSLVSMIPIAGDAIGKSGKGLRYADEVAGLARETTILGENMKDRVIPFAQATGARTLPWGTTPQAWAEMTPRQRYRLNDGELRKRINEGDNFRYIGQDPFRSPSQRARFDLTASELLRLSERGIPYQVVSPTEVFRTIGRL